MQATPSLQVDNERVIVTRWTFAPGAETGDIFADLNPGSLEVLPGALVEPALAEGRIAEAIQFERQGYFALDRTSRADQLVYNQTMALRDGWAKIQAKEKGAGS